MAKPIQVRWGFALAYTLIVIAVTIGFFWQAGILDSLHDTQDGLRDVTVRQARLIRVLERRQTTNEMAVCELTVALHPDPAEREVARRLFDRYGIDCRPEVAG